jgi:hypothetical protein
MGSVVRISASSVRRRFPETDLAGHQPFSYLAIVPETKPMSFTLDRSAFSVGRLNDEDSQVDYWLSQPPERRIAAVEFLRRSFNPDAYSAQRLHGLFETAKRA